MKVSRRVTIIAVREAKRLIDVAAAAAEKRSTKGWYADLPATDRSRDRFNPGRRTPGTGHGRIANLNPLGIVRSRAAAC